MPGNVIMKQLDGIPMGGCLSPAMTILTTAWMEREWISGMHPLDQIFFKGTRYMDDVMLFVSKAPDWD